MLRTCEINGKEKKTCGMKNVLDKMLPLCEGKQRCDKMIVNATEFGDPGKCRGIRTYLVMDIRCGKFLCHFESCTSGNAGGKLASP